jgi:hypothetical protein
MSEQEKFKNVGKSPLELKWEKFPYGLLWWDDCTFIGAIEVKNSKELVSKWEYHWLTFTVWDDEEDGGFELRWADEECREISYSAWSIDDFDFIAITSGSRPVNSDGTKYKENEK